MKISPKQQIYRKVRIRLERGNVIGIELSIIGEPKWMNTTEGMC